MFFAGLGTATPSKRYAQTECWEAVQTTPQFARLNLRSRAILKKVLLANNGIQTRALALDELEEVFEKSIVPAMSDWRPGDQPVYISDIHKAEKEFGWNVSLPKLNEIVDLTI